MWRTVSRVSLAVSVAATAAVLPTSLASATTTAGLPGCAEKSLCGWSGTNFTGLVTTFPAGAGCLNSPFPLQSVANTYQGGGAGIPVILSVYSDKDCSGKYLGSVARGQSLPSLPSPGISVWSVW